MVGLVSPHEIADQGVDFLTHLHHIFTHSNGEDWLDFASQFFYLSLHWAEIGLEAHSIHILSQISLAHCNWA